MTTQQDELGFWIDRLKEINDDLKPFRRRLAYNAPLTFEEQCQLHSLLAIASIDIDFLDCLHRSGSKYRINYP